MPTLIRLFIFLLVLAGLVFGGMVALTIFVNPGSKEVVIKIPTRELVAPPPDASDPLGINQLPDPVGIVSRESSAPAPSGERDDQSSVKTIEPPPE